MPTYTWECPKCNATTEVTRTMSDIEKGPDKCDNCDNTQGLKRTIAAAPKFILQGGGWHDQLYTKTRSRQ